MRCFKSASSNLALIRLLGRPGIVSLRDANRKPAYALLTGLSERDATLRLGETTKTVPLATLARLWRGDFATYWRAPPAYQNQAVGAAPGPVADWLATQLSALEGGPPGDKQISDVALKAKINAFQRAQGLEPDGLAGPVTLMQLNRAIGVDEPRLASGR